MQVLALISLLRAGRDYHPSRSCSPLFRFSGSSWRTLDVERNGPAADSILALARASKKMRT
jgi:hypothetical protein